MKLNKLKINSFGKLKNKEIKLNDKMNIIYGENESGKSTLLNFIKCSFYGISKNKNGKNISDYDKYLPWSGEEFSGKIEYSLDNERIIEIFRDFKKKNPEIYDSYVNDISNEFEIDKKEGNKFFREQTGIDENMYLSTIMTNQNSMVLDNNNQNVLIQKIANIAGTGEDNISYKSAINKINKKQIEEIGSNRTQDRPINIIDNKLFQIKTNLINNKNNLEDFNKINEEKEKINEKILLEENKLNIINKIEKIIQNKKIFDERIKIKIKLKNEILDKVDKLIEEKDEIIKIGNEKYSNFNEDDFIYSKNKINKLNYISFGLIIISILINIFVKYKLVNYIAISLFLISFFYIIFNLFKINKLKKENKLNKIDFNIKRRKIEEQISNLNNKIKELKKEIDNKEIEIENENINIEKEINNKIEKLKYDSYNSNCMYLFNLNDPNQIKNEINNINKNILNLNLQLNNLEFKENEINKIIENNIVLNEQYESLMEEKKILEEKNKYIEITRDLIEKSYIKMKENVTPKFTNNMSNIMSKITNNKYNKIIINNENNIMVEKENEEYINANLLSIGTIDQIYLALRVSMIDELSSEKLPIIFDEVFAYCDDERLENILKFLNDISNDYQIILLTCTKREKEILNKLNIQYNYINL